MSTPLSKVSQYISEAKATSFHEARKRHQGDVFAFVVRRIKPVEEAEDIVAQVFVDAFRNWNRRRGEPKWWLLGIARRKVCDAYRKQRPAPLNLREEDPPTANAMTDFVAQAEAQEAYRIVLLLPVDQRDAFLMQVLEGLSLEEIGAVMDKKPAAVNSLLQRARNNIRKLAAHTSGQGDNY